MADDDDFTKTESTADTTVPCQCSSIRKNGYAVLDGFPCKVVDMSTSKTGKHGHAKVHLVGIDIFDGKKHEELCPSTHNLLVPVVKRVDLQLLSINDEEPPYLSLLMPDGSTREDLQIPEGELGEQIMSSYKADKTLLLTIQSAMGREAVIAVKESSGEK